MENKKGHGKTITATEMYNRTILLGHEKLKKNAHKPDFLSLDAFELFEELRVETSEFKKAYRLHERDPTLKNKNNLDLEAGDVLNCLSAIVVKTDGYNSLDRE